jgi:hypothetical protein
VKGTGEIDGTRVQALLNTLSNLHAVRWLGATKPQNGLEKPQLTLAFTSSPDNKASHKLIIGAPANDGTWYAHADGREGTFVISNSDLNTLRLSVVAQLSPIPSRTPSVAP